MSSIAADAGSAPARKDKVPAYGWACLAVTVLIAFAPAFAMFKVPPLSVTLMGWFQIDQAAYGWMMSLFSLLGVVFAYPAVGLANKYGYKQITVASLVALCIGTVVGALSGTSYEIMLVSRFLEGAALAIVWVTGPTICAAWFPKSRTGIAVGIFSMRIPVGSFIIVNLSPRIAAALGSWQSVWWVCLVYTVIVTIVFVIVFKMPEIKAESNPKMAEYAKANAQAEAQAQKVRSEKRHPLKNKSLWFLGIAFLLFNIITPASTTNYFPMFLQQVHDFNPSDAAFVASWITTMGVVGAPLAGALSDKLRTRKWTAFVGLVFALLVAIFLYSGWSEAWQMWLIVLVCPVFLGFMPTSTLAIVPDITKDPRDIGMGMATVQFCSNIGSVIGGSAMGWGMSVFGGMTAAGFQMAAWTILIPCAVVAMILLVGFVKVR